MILVDKNIKSLCNDGKLISSGYKEENVNCISYDLTIGDFLSSNEQSIDIMPGEFVIVKTNEELKIPVNITGRIGEKNSLLRLGLMVDGPQYHPGHTTYAFLRIQNISDCVITIEKDMPIAQIFFEELKEIPETPYDKKTDASFQNEKEYRGFGNYEAKYTRNLKSFEKVKNDIEGMSNKIYANVLTLMGVLVAIFSMLSINYQAFTSADLTPNYVMAMNISLVFCIIVMLGMIFIIINGCKNKRFSIFYTALIIALGCLSLIFSIKIF